MFLIETLNRLTRNRILTFWAIIEHKGEDDEGGKKDHFHLYAEPSKSVQTDDIRASFIEPIPNEKPLACLPFRTTSNFGEWYKY